MLHQIVSAHPGWSLLALTLVVLVAIRTLFRIANRVIRSRNIQTKGWPPPHLDADGDSVDHAASSWPHL